jgi:hypothetical protein
MAGGLVWREEEGERDSIRGFRRFGEAEELATESEPQR